MSTLPLLHLEYTCTREEFARAQSLVRSSKWLWPVGVVAFAMMAYLFFTQVAPGERLRWLGIYGTVWIVALLVLRRSGNPGPQFIRLFLLPDGVRVITPKLDRQFHRSELEPLAESDVLFLLQNRGRDVRIPIPKRAIPDAESQAVLRSLLNEGQ